MQSPLVAFRRPTLALLAIIHVNDSQKVMMPYTRMRLWSL